MFEPIKKLAQANDPILNNLQNTENKLQELNKEVGSIVSEYNNLNYGVQNQASFFNFDNPYFLLTLVSLFVLALALWFLRYELKAKNKASKKVEPKTFIQKSDPFHDNKEKKEEEEPRITYNSKKEKPAATIKKVKSSGKKIKVVKVK